MYKYTWLNNVEVLLGYSVRDNNRVKVFMSWTLSLSSISKPTLNSSPDQSFENGDDIPEKYTQIHRFRCVFVK